MRRQAFFVLLIVLLMLVTPVVHAHCPLCTAAVGAAAVSAKYYGMDASIIGLLIGAFGISTGLWAGLKIKKQYFKFQLPAIVLASFLLTIIPIFYIQNDAVYLPLLLFGQSGSVLNKVYWVDKMLFGSILGGIITLTAYWTHVAIKKAKGKVLFPFQGVAITLLFLLVSGIGIYLIFK